MFGKGKMTGTDKFVMDKGRAAGNFKQIPAGPAGMKGRGAKPKAKPPMQATNMDMGRGAKKHGLVRTLGKVGKVA